MVALQEDRTLPLLANRRAENDGCVLARPLLGVPNLAARDFEDERSDAEASGGAAAPAQAPASSGGGERESSGALASDEALAALREKLSGGQS